MMRFRVFARARCWLVVMAGKTIEIRKCVHFAGTKGKIAYS